MDRTLFALSLGLAGMILLPLPLHAANQPCKPFQTSSAPISSSDHVTI